jgi:hypothetical protein
MNRMPRNERVELIRQLVDDRPAGETMDEAFARIAGILKKKGIVSDRTGRPLEPNTVRADYHYGDKTNAKISNEEKEEQQKLKQFKDLVSSFLSLDATDAIKLKLIQQAIKKS